MSGDPDIQAGLSLLFQKGLELALKIQDDAMAAAPEDRAKLAAAFHRVSRSVRQTAALKAKLERDAVRAIREDDTEARRRDERVRLHRRAQVKAVMERLIWTEAEGDDHAELLSDNLDLFLDEDVLAEDFLSDPLDTYIAKLRIDLNLPDPDPNPRPEGEVSAKPTEGVEARLHHPACRRPDHPFSSA